MKKIKNYALGLLGVTLLSAGIYACSSEGTSNSKKQEESTIFQIKSNDDDFRGGQIAVIENGTAVPLYNEADAKKELVAGGVYTEVESIELAYGLNPDTNEYEAFVTLIGVEAATATVVGIVADLVIDGDKLIILNPETNEQAFAKNSCAGSNCSWCQFDRSWFLGRIKGCKPCQRVIEEGKPSGCVHSLNSAGLPALELAKELSKLAL